MLDWVKEHDTLLWILSIASIAVLVVSFFLVPFVVARIRPDYFIHKKRPDRSWIDQAPWIRLLIHIGKNVLGVVLMVAGLMMLLLPGPGLVTLLIGFLLLDFPGKYRFECWLVSRPAVYRPINWLRKRAGRMPLERR